MEATQPAPSSQRSRTRSPLRARTHALRGKRSLCPRLPLRCPRPKRSLSPNIVFRAGLPSTSFAASLPQPAKEALGFVETCAGLSAAWPSLPAVAALSWCLPCRSLHGVLARLLAHARASHSLLACAHLHLRIYVRAYLRTHSHTHSRHSHTHTHTHTRSHTHTHTHTHSLTRSLALAVAGALARHRRRLNVRVLLERRQAGGRRPARRHGQGDFERRPNSNTCKRACALVAIAALAAAATAACATVPFYITGLRHELFAPSPPSLAATHRPPCFRVMSLVAVPLCLCRRIASFPPCCHLAVAAVLVMYNNFSGHEGQVPAVSRITFRITSSDA